jgi:hypothetical protein
MTILTEHSEEPVTKENPLEHYDRGRTCFLQECCGSEFWLVKVNSEGAMEWDSRFGNGKPEYQSNEAFSIVVAPDVGYALAGHV